VRPTAPTGMDSRIRAVMTGEYREVMTVVCIKTGGGRQKIHNERYFAGVLKSLFL